MATELSFYERTGFHSFDEIYRAHHGEIERYVRKKVQNYSDVEDIVQQTFLVLLKKKDDFISRHKNGVERYLYVAARTRTAEYYRKETRRRKNEKQLEEELTVGQFSRRTTMYAGEGERLIQKIKTILPEKYWQVFLPRVFEGYSYQEISERLGIDVNTARQRQLRAKKQLQSEMEDYK